MATGGFRDIAAAMRKRRSAMEPTLARGIAECTRLVWKVSRDNMQALIYAKPPDRTKKASGKALPKGRRGGKGFRWTQTGNLLRSEKKRTRNVEGWVENAAKAKKGGTGYAHARHNLALGSGDPLLIPPAPRRKRKSTRIAPFRALAIRDTHDERQAILRAHVKRTRGV